MAVDVGTGSGRVAIFDDHGLLLGKSIQNIITKIEPPKNSEDETMYNQSSGDIWNKICIATRTVLAEHATLLGDYDICSMAFDATCSLSLIK